MPIIDQMLGIGLHLIRRTLKKLSPKENYRMRKEKIEREGIDSVKLSFRK